MLVLARRIGETVLFFENGQGLLKIKMTKTTPNVCTFKVTNNAGRIYELNVARTESYRLTPDIELTVIAVSRGVVKLGFDAPKSVKILRAELLHETLT